MFINKIGSYHTEYGTNCQDFGYKDSLSALVCDGCSEGTHSEVGAKLFTHVWKNNMGFGIDSIFENMIDVIGDNPEYIRDFLCFTILRVDTYPEAGWFKVHNCGDGFIITEDKEDNINFIELNDGEYPKYYVYNFMDKDHLSHYKDGVDFTEHSFLMSEYKRVGIASDGIRFMVNPAPENILLKDEFIQILKEDKAGKMKRFINKHHNIFKDDVTIAF